jgi:hypothetical protein
METLVTGKELDRNAARRLAIIRHAEEVTGNVAKTCRYYRISRQVFYTWLRRYQAEGVARLRDRSRRPAHCPHEAPSEVVAKIIYLRTTYHFGPAKIAMYLIGGLSVLRQGHARRGSPAALGDGLVAEPL